MPLAVCVEGLPNENGLVVLREMLARSLPHLAFTGQLSAFSRSAGAHVAIADHLPPLPSQ